MCNRCDWSKNSELEKQYHDTEWGKINKNEQYLFEMLCLEGMQAGLSWSLILKKREAYRNAFMNFDYHTVAKMKDETLEELLISEKSQHDIIKNRNKIFAIRNNAQMFLKVQEEFGNFATYIWAFTHGEQIINEWKTQDELPAATPLSTEISKDLKKRGFKFVGPVIVYSYLQSIGMINDHLLACDFR